jgi:RNA polymerase sigma-70 factor (ECF subfamily)
MATSIDQVQLEHWIQDRDADAFNELAQRYAGLVFGACLRITRNRADAEDATQECFQSLASVTAIPLTPLGPWLHRVATNGALDQVKAKNRRVSREQEYADENRPVVESNWNDIDALIDRAIAELPDDLRVPIVAHFIEGQTYTSLSESLGLSRQVIAYRVKKGTRLLRRALKKNGVSVSLSALLTGMTARLSLAETVPVGTTAAIGRMALVGAVHQVNAGGNATAIGSPVLGKTLVGGIVMSTTTKAYLSVGAIALCLAVLYWMKARNEPETLPSDQTSVPAVALARNESKIETTVTSEVDPAPAEVVEVSLVEEPEKSPIDGLWLIESYSYVDPIDARLSAFVNSREGHLYRIDTEGNSTTFSLLEPWRLNATFRLWFGGVLDGASVDLRGANDESRLSSNNIRLRGRFNADWTTFEGEGQIEFDETDTKSIERHGSTRYNLILSRVEDRHGEPTISNDDALKLSQSRAESLGAALYSYALDHGGELPDRLNELIPDYLDDETLIHDTAGRTVRYSGGEMPKGLLEEGVAWEEFNPDMLMRDRLEEWEAYQRERWGSSQPVLPTVLTISYDDLQITFSIDPLGRVVQREYWMSEDGASLFSEVYAESANMLQQLAINYKMFEAEHDYFPAGMTSLYPEYLDDVSVLSHLLDPPGSPSWVQVIPASHGLDYDDQSVTPLLVQVLPENAAGSRILVLFLDGHISGMSEADYQDRYADFPVEPHLNW